MRMPGVAAAARALIQTPLGVVTALLGEYAEAGVVKTREARTRERAAARGADATSVARGAGALGESGGSANESGPVRLNRERAGAALEATPERDAARSARTRAPAAVRTGDAERRAAAATVATREDLAAPSTGRSARRATAAAGLICG
jgi:hypothetical protein